jgi:hypothetical protein
LAPPTWSYFARALARARSRTRAQTFVSGLVGQRWAVVGLAARTVFQLFFDIASAQPRPGDPLCQGCKNACSSMPVMGGFSGFHEKSEEAEEKNRETKASSHKGWDSKAIPLMMHGDAVPCASVGKETRIHSDIQIHKEVSSSATKEELMRQEFLPKLGEQSDNQIDNQSTTLDAARGVFDEPDFWKAKVEGDDPAFNSPPKKNRR